MNDGAAVPLSDFRVLLRCACISIIVTLSAFEIIGWRLHWFAHPQKTTGLDESKFIEAQMLQLPEVSHLTSETPTYAAHKAEATISKVAEKGRQATEAEKKALEDSQQNVTKSVDSGANLGPTHGPVAIYMPSPVIPDYLRNQELNRNVVIEFLVSAQGNVTPRLLVSSDNEELDAIAVETAKQWHFRPAENDSKPIDSKVRLRIVFTVK